MGYVGATLRIPFNSAGFQYGRDTEFLSPFALVEPTANVNFHEGGIGKRGGTAYYLGSALSGTPTLQGIHQFRLQNGNKIIVFGANGKLYHTDESNVLKTGMSGSNKFSFATFDNELYIADGSSIPQVWDGGSASTSDIAGIPTDWSSSSNYPFQIIAHSRGASARMWAITADAVYASASGDGDDFSDLNVKKIPVYTEGGLVGGFDFGGTLFVFSKTKTYLIDDTSTTVSEWGYKEAIWEGGAAHWRLVTKAGNNYYLCTDDMTVYSITGVQATGDYKQVNLTRPAYIDRWFRDKVTRTSVEDFHCVYDRELRCINYFVRVGGSNNNTCMRFFVDRPPELAWIIQNNTSYSSGFNAAVSTEVQENTGIYKVYTGDFSGQIWKHEQTAKSDNSNPYTSLMKIKPINIQNPRSYKHFRRGLLRISSSGNTDLTVRVYIDGVRKDDIAVSQSGLGATFGTAIFGTSVFAQTMVIPLKFGLGYYGYDFQLELINDTADQDIFYSELLVDFKELATR